MLSKFWGWLINRDPIDHTHHTLLFDIEYHHQLIKNLEEHVDFLENKMIGMYRKLNTNAE